MASTASSTSSDPVTAPLNIASTTATAQSQPHIRPTSTLLRPPQNPNPNNHPPVFIGKPINSTSHSHHGGPTTPSFYPSVGSARAFPPRPIPDRTATVARNSSPAPPAPMQQQPQLHHPQQLHQHVTMPGGPHLSMRAPPKQQQQQYACPRQHLQVGAAGNHRSVPPAATAAAPQVKITPLPPAAAAPVKISNDMDKSREEPILVIHDRKVRLSEENSSSLYALCRSWVRNGLPQETQPKIGEGLKILPKPLPAKSNAHVQDVDEDASEVEDEDLGCVEQLTTEDLLKGHVKRAKRVRERLRKERMSRIERYKQRLSLLLPTQSELMARNEATP